MSAKRQAILLAIDDASLPLRRDLVLYRTKPDVRSEPVLLPTSENANAPDALAAHFYGTVLHDEGKFRMWYYPCSWGLNPDWPAEVKAQLRDYNSELSIGPLCYAESDDGLRWVKPKLRQMRFKGSEDHNALKLPDALTHGANVIRDDDEPDPARRYKLVYLAYTYTGKKIWGDIRVAFSADGIEWVVNTDPFNDDFVEQASFYKFNGLYVINGQKAGTTYAGEGGNPLGRQGFSWISPDSTRWLSESASSFALPEPRDPAARGADKPYDQVHIGVGAGNYGNVLVGLYGIWHNKPEFHDIGCDLGLLVSNDGITFREPAKGQVFLAADQSPVTPAKSKRWPTVLTQGNGILNVGDKTYVYHGRWRNAELGPDYYAEVALATLPRDRWGGLGLAPDKKEGSVWSAPVTLPAAGRWKLSLNADGADAMRVEVANERFDLLPEYSDANSGKCAGSNGVESPVIWRSADVARLAGQTVRLRVHVRRSDGATPRLYAAYLRQGD